MVQVELATSVTAVRQSIRLIAHNTTRMVANTAGVYGGTGICGEAGGGGPIPTAEVRDANSELLESSEADATDDCKKRLQDVMGARQTALLRDSPSASRDPPLSCSLCCCCCCCSPHRSRLARCAM